MKKTSQSDAERKVFHWLNIGKVDTFSLEMFVTNFHMEGVFSDGQTHQETRERRGTVAGQV